MVKCILAFTRRGKRGWTLCGFPCYLLFCVRQTLGFPINSFWWYIITLNLAEKVPWLFHCILLLRRFNPIARINVGNVCSCLAKEEPNAETTKTDWCKQKASFKKCNLMSKNKKLGNKRAGKRESKKKLRIQNPRQTRKCGGTKADTWGGNTGKPTTWGKQMNRQKEEKT